MPPERQKHGKLPIKLKMVMVPVLNKKRLKSSAMKPCREIAGETILTVKELLTKYYVK